MLVEIRNNDISTGIPVSSYIGEIWRSEAEPLKRPADCHSEDQPEIVTSNCAFIGSDPKISGNVLHSTKSVKLSRHLPVRYTIKARKKVSEIIEILKQNDDRKAMFVIYECFMDSHKEQDYHICDEILHSIMDMDFDIRINLSFLMASYSLKRYLSYRPLFYDKVCKKAMMLREYESLSEILKGLR